MSPVFPVALTQLEMKAIWCRLAMTSEIAVPEIDQDEALAESVWTGLRKLQHASHVYFTPATT
jgi:hypothetical protein